MDFDLNKIEYKLCDPNGNITILVTSNVKEEERLSVADLLMKQEPTAEQVGFVSQKAGQDFDAVLEMAGGEFCGNATLCTAALAKGQKETVRVKVSGCDEILAVTVTERDGLFTASTKMPSPKSAKAVTLNFKNNSYDAFAVDLGTITHLIMKTEIDKVQAEEAIKEWCTGSAMGIMFFDEETSNLTPLVYSKTANTLFFENACASGTTALGIYLAIRENRQIEKEIKQPGGVLKIKASPDGDAYLTGTVKFL